MAKWSKVRWPKAHPVQAEAAPVQVLPQLRYPKIGNHKPHHRTGKTAARMRRERALQRLIQRHSLTPRNERVVLEMAALRKRV